MRALTLWRMSRVLRSSAADTSGIDSSIKNKLLLTLASPSATFYANRPVASVTVPGVEGALTFTNNHSQGVTQLKPGVITVRLEQGEPQQFFMTNGFAFYHA